MLFFPNISILFFLPLSPLSLSPSFTLSPPRHRECSALPVSSSLFKHVGNPTARYGITLHTSSIFVYKKILPLPQSPVEQPALTTTFSPSCLLFNISHWPPQSFHSNSLYLSQSIILTSLPLQPGFHSPSCPKHSCQDSSNSSGLCLLITSTSKTLTLDQQLYTSSLPRPET